MFASLRYVGDRSRYTKCYELLDGYTGPKI
jgi:hypothetical protein